MEQTGVDGGRRTEPKLGGGDRADMNKMEQDRSE